MSAAVGRHRSLSNRRPVQPQMSVTRGKEPISDAPLEPCAATDSLLLFAQGSTVLCLRHDTLTVERKFQKHVEDIRFISVDNVSERGAGSLVVTYDVGKTAIVWDVFSGEQLSRFASYEPLHVAAWMRNGNIAFGNEKGEVILFEPSTSEHVSARTIFDPITAIAPSSDCKTYAIGYRNGSILLASLQPSFTILHTLTTSRAPSPIASLTWHTSSSKQKSDMLATQAADGDLRVWSVPKPPTASGPRVIRALKRTDDFRVGRCWISWSKNGRILQFSDGETCAWDVKTKDVTSQPVPLIEGVRAVAAYGPSGTLFTLGPDDTVQQYDVDRGEMMANVRCPPVTIPPTPPEELRQMNFQSASESEGDPSSPGFHYSRDRGSYDAPRRRPQTPPSSHNRKESRTRQPDVMSPTLKSERSVSSTSGHQYAHVQPQPQTNNYPQSPVSTKSTSLRKGSRLRQEVIMSPQEPAAPDLFPFTRARLGDVKYRPPRAFDDETMTPDDLRRQMLSIVFGWDDDIADLIQDELGRHPIDSPNAVYLYKWLNNDAEDMVEMMASAPANPALDWTRLALGILDERSASKKMCHIFIEKMLTRGEIHAAATILLALGDRNDAIEVYVSRNYYLEAILLACLVMPADWQRQSFLVRRWGEHVVENSQQQLAIRCFSCTGQESSEPWVSPTAQMASQMASPVVSLTQPDIYRKTMERRGTTDAATPVAMPAPPMPLRSVTSAASRVTPQTSALKLITSFGAKSNEFKFPGLKGDDRTPTNAGTITPIAESAISRSALSPGGLGSYRMNNVRSLNNAMPSRSGTPAHNRHRLPSIGEGPSEEMSEALAPRAPPTPADSGSDKERDRAKTYAGRDDGHRQKAQQILPPLLTAARFDPSQNVGEPTPQTAVASHAGVQFPPVNAGAEHAASSTRQRESSRSRRPDNLSFASLRSHNMNRHDETLLAYGNSISRPMTTESRTTTQFDSINEDYMNPPVTGQSLMSGKSANANGRSLDRYISSLEQAQSYQREPRSRSVGKTARDEPSERKKSKTRSRAPSEHRSEHDVRHNVPAPKRSPSSPVPMSPEDLQQYSVSVESFDLHRQPAPTTEALSHGQGHGRREPAPNTDANRYRHRSRSRHAEGTSNTYNHQVHEPVPELESAPRGRSKSRKEGSTGRSPSSPLPMIPSPEDLQSKSGTESALRLVAQNRQRLARSTSRRPEESTLRQRESSPERRKRVRSRSRQPAESGAMLTRKASLSTKERVQGGTSHESSGHHSTSSFNMPSDMESLERYALGLDMELGVRQENRSVNGGDPRRLRAQAELEARRLSLARRPSAPAIPLPGSDYFRTRTPMGADRDVTAVHDDTATEAQLRSGTPRAMDHPSRSHSSSVPDVPDVPDRWETLSPVAYQPPPSAEPRPGSARHPSTSGIDGYAPADVPSNMPRHPAFDMRVNTSRGANDTPRERGTSRGRGVSQDRGKSRERSRARAHDPQAMYDSICESTEYIDVDDAPVVPLELAHLAVPPPPPPPPAPPLDVQSGLGLRVQIDPFAAANIPLPSSAYPGDLPAPLMHRRTDSRGKPTNESPAQFMGKIRTITDRMRSNSRNREMTRSPPNEDVTAPYETFLGSPPLATVMEGR